MLSQWGVFRILSVLFRYESNRELRILFNHSGDNKGSLPPGAEYHVKTLYRGYRVRVRRSHSLLYALIYLSFNLVMGVGHFKVNRQISQACIKFGFHSFFLESD